MFPWWIQLFDTQEEKVTAGGSEWKTGAREDESVHGVTPGVMAHLSFGVIYLSHSRCVKAITHNSTIWNFFSLLEEHMYIIKCLLWINPMLSYPFTLSTYHLNFVFVSYGKGIKKTLYTCILFFLLTLLSIYFSLLMSLKLYRSCFLVSFISLFIHNRCYFFPCFSLCSMLWLSSHCRTVLLSTEVTLSLETPWNIPLRLSLSISLYHSFLSAGTNKAHWCLVLRLSAPLASWAHKHKKGVIYPLCLLLLVPYCF